MPSYGNWTEPRVDHLKWACEAGEPASRIAERLGGVTRNAVIGKLHRIGMATNPMNKGGGAHISYRLADKRRARRARPNGKTHKTRPQPVKSKARPPKPLAPVITPAGHFYLRLRLEDLEPNSCRFPLGDGPFLFCGQPQVDGSSYCPHCYRITRGGFR